MAGCQGQAYTKRHAQLPQADCIGQIKLLYHVAETHGFVLLMVLRIEDGSTKQVPCHCQKTAPDQGFTGYRIACEIDVCKTV